MKFTAWIKRISENTGRGGGIAVEFLDDDPIVGLRTVHVTSLPAYFPNLKWEVVLEDSKTALNLYDIVEVKKCVPCDGDKRVLHRNPIYYKLLCFFSDIYLTTVFASDGELEAWQRLWKKIKEKPQDLLFNSDYDCHTVTKRPMGKQRAYTDRKGFWSFEDYLYAIKIFSPETIIDEDIIKGALKLYHDFCRRRQYYGYYFLEVSQDMDGRCIKFLIDNGYMCYPTVPRTGAPLTAAYLTDKYHDEIVENIFVKEITKDGHPKFFIYSCSFYDNSVFGTQLVKLIMEVKSRFGSSNVLCLTANRACVDYIDDLCSGIVKFTSVDEFLNEKKTLGKRKHKESKRAIILDRATRIGPLFFSRLLSIIDGCEEVHFVCDLDEKWTPPNRGGGSMISDIQSISIVRHWEPIETQTKIQQTHVALNKVIPRGLSRHFYSLDDVGKLFDDIETVCGGNKATNNHYVVCSSVPLCHTLKRALNNHFFIGKLVYDEHSDYLGPITKARRVNNSDELRRKDEIVPGIPHHITIGSGDHSITVINTRHPVVDGCILPVENICAPPRDHVCFIIDSQTTRVEHLLSMVKFARVGLHLFVEKQQPSAFLADCLKKHLPGYVRTLIPKKMEH